MSLFVGAYDSAARLFVTRKAVSLLQNIARQDTASRWITCEYPTVLFDYRRLAVTIVGALAADMYPSRSRLPLFVGSTPKLSTIGRIFRRKFAEWAFGIKRLWYNKGSKSGRLNNIRSASAILCRGCFVMGLFCNGAALRAGRLSPRIYRTQSSTRCEGFQTARKAVPEKYIAHDCGENKTALS